MDTLRDSNGRLLPGHPGLKQKGSTNLLHADIRQKLFEFIAGEIDNLPEFYQTLKPAEKIRILTAIMQMTLPKPQNIPHEPEPIQIKILWTEPHEISD
jgi:hypothetical protein